MTPNTTPNLTTRGAELASVLALADNRLPVGGHVHSGGLEEAVESGLVTSLETLHDYAVRRIETTGLVAASIAAAIAAGILPVEFADLEADARTPSPASRAASRAQGRGYLRFAKHAWPEGDWARFPQRPHQAVILGAIAVQLRIGPAEIAQVALYTALTGVATAGQRLLALDPAAVGALVFRLSARCAELAEEAARGLVDDSDPLQDMLAERHIRRERPLFGS